MNQIIEYSNTTFEDIKNIDESGIEYLLERELMKALEYSKWWDNARRFTNT